MATIPTEGNDYLVFTAASEHAKGKGGNDTIKAGAGNDRVQAGNGNDLAYGEAGNDTMYGEAGNDTMYGGAGNDWILAETGTDQVYGDDGNDHLRVIGGDGHSVYGGGGDDYFWAKTSTAATRTYSGGSGADFFEISTATIGDIGGNHRIAPLGKVVLTDFNPSQGDVLSLVYIHDTKWNWGSLSYDKANHTLHLKGFSGSGHGEYGQIVFPSGLSERDIASHLLIDFGDAVGQHSVLV